MTLLRLGLFCLMVLPGVALAAAPDGNIEEDGLSHLMTTDLRPLCPVDGESFLVHFQALKDDLTSARLWVDGAWIDATVLETKADYDVWVASVPATVANQVEYVLELTDGADVGYYGPSGWSTTLPGSRYEIDFQNLTHAPYGATPTSTGMVFRVWAPTRTTAHVRGDFNGWGLGNPMSKQGDSFIARVDGAAAGQMYKYFFNNVVWNSDPRGRALNPADNLNSIVEDPLGYTWISGHFQTPPQEQLVVYQLHVGSFAGRNDPLGSTPFPSRYQDVAARVGHLADLGVNAIQLNPIHEFPGDISAGYNPITQYAPEWKYGSPDDLKALVDACHANGIAVLLDIVWNHFSPTDNFLWFYDGTQIYFDDPAVDTPWGAQADFDDPQVRSYFLDSVATWLDEFRMDGFRMDATSFMDIAPQGAAGWSLMQELNDLVDRRWRSAVVVAEELPDDSFITRPTSLGGAGFDTQYYDVFTDTLRQEIQDAAFGSPDMNLIANILNGGGSFLSGRHVFNYFELHDEAWPQNGGQRMVVTIDPTAPHDDTFAQGRHKLAHGLVLTAPGVPAILQGAEWLESTGWGPDFDKRLDWSNKTTYAHIFDYFRDLIALRTSNPALFASASRNVHHVDESGDVIGFVRSDGSGNQLVVLANFANADRLDYRIGLPASGGWEEALNSQASQYGGSGPTNPGLFASEPTGWDGYPQSAVVDVPAMGLVVLRWVGSATPAEELAAPIAQSLEWMAANPSSGQGRVRFSLPASGRVTLDLVDVRGRRVRQLVSRAYSSGTHELGLDVRSLASGVYFLRMQSSSGHTATKRVLFVR